MRRWTRRRIAALAAAGLVAAAALAHADPAAEARFHDEEARKHYEAGRYDRALEAFFREQRVAPNPRIAFNIALCFAQLGRSEEAYMYFAEYAASSDQDTERRAFTQKSLAELEGKVARVRVKTNPPGARVYVDKLEHGDYGATPRVVALAEGERKIWVELDGHRRAERVVAAKKGQEVTVELSLEAVLGTLSVASSAPGEALVKNAAGEIVAKGATPLAAKIRPGSYEVEVRAKGHKPWRGLAEVVAEASRSVAAAPEPLPKPTGDVTVTANRSGAVVELDGEPAGFTPTILGGVGVGRHRLRVRGDGVREWVGAVDVGADERSWVTVALEPPSATTRASATWVLAGLGGLSLLGSGVTGYMALSNTDDFNASRSAGERADLRDRGIALRTASDVMLVTGLVTVGAAAVLYFVTEKVEGRESSATVSKGDR
ncbi:MAG: PEGA domain-containing protein [Polyangiaceae bacterium]|nr:PEGA domain-containing protein [Polyangiaceae bacterium]